MERLIRLGRVSAIDYEKGMMQVTYPDLDDAVTRYLPYMSFNDEYKMPEIGEDVYVLHLPSGQAGGVVIGPAWNKAAPPAQGGAGLYRKEVGTKNGEAFVRYQSPTYEIDASNIKFVSAAGTITVAEIISHIQHCESCPYFNG